METEELSSDIQAAIRMLSPSHFTYQVSKLKEVFKKSKFGLVKFWNSLSECRCNIPRTLVILISGINLAGAMM